MKNFFPEFQIRHNRKLLNFRSYELRQFWSIGTFVFSEIFILTNYVFSRIFDIRKLFETLFLFPFLLPIILIEITFFLIGWNFNFYSKFSYRQKSIFYVQNFIQKISFWWKRYITNITFFDNDNDKGPNYVLNDQILVL